MVFSFFVIMDLSRCGFLLATSHFHSTLFHVLRDNHPYSTFCEPFFVLLCSLLDDVCVNSAWPKKLSSQWFLFVKLNSSLRKFYGRHQVLVNCYGICVKWQWIRVVIITRSFPHLWHILWFETRITRRVPWSRNCLPLRKRVLVGFVLLDL